jgi:tetratricopeptide (TPR) repeat protein
VPDASVKVAPAQAKPEPEREPTAAELIAEGDEHKHAGAYDDAIDAYENAVEPLTAEHGRESLEFADLLVKTEDAYLARDNEDDIDDLNCNDYLRALSVMERCVGPLDQRLLPVLNRIIAFYLLIGKVSEAEGLVRRQQLIEQRAKAKQAQQSAPASPALSVAEPGSSSASPHVEPVSVATSIAIDAHQSLRAALETGNSSVDKSAADGDSARLEFDYDGAADHYGEALEAAQESFGRDAIQLVPILVRLGEVCHARDVLDSDNDGDTYTDPIDRTRLALSLLVKEGGMQDARLVPVLTNMVAFSDQTGDHFKADRYLAMLDNINEASRRITLR